MRATDLVQALAENGFLVTRRAGSLVWLKRDKQALIVDEAVELQDTEAESILREARRVEA